MGYDIDGRYVPPEIAALPKILYVYSNGNPAAYYGHIECAVFGHRCLITGKRYVNINNMSGKYSGVHVYGQSFVKSVSIKNCDFRFIGGCVWDRIQRIRFGNGIEVWEYGEDVTVENCYFDQVYDPAPRTRASKMKSRACASTLSITSSRTTAWPLTSFATL